MKTQAQQLSDDLQSVVEGVMTVVDFRARNPIARHDGALEKILCLVEHYLADGDIRRRDTGYRTMQNAEMRTLIALLRSGRLDEATHVHFLGPSGESAEEQAGMNSAEHLLSLLRRAIDNREELAQQVAAFQQAVWHSKDWERGLAPSTIEVLRTLAYDLDYYLPDPVVQQPDNSFFGAERALSEIRSALARIS